MATATTTQEIEMTTTVNAPAVPTIGPYDSFREDFASALCRLAAAMPYSSENAARNEMSVLVCNWGIGEFPIGIKSYSDLLDRAIIVRAAAEGVTA